VADADLRFLAVVVFSVNIYFYFLALYSAAPYPASSPQLHPWSNMTDQQQTTGFRGSIFQIMERLYVLKDVIVVSFIFVSAATVIAALIILRYVRGI